MKPSFRCIAAVPALLLAACASTTGSQYFSLVDSHAQLSATHEATGKPIAIHLQPVELPAQIDRPQIVLSTAGSDALMLLNESVWAAPLSNEIRQAMSLSLADQLDAISIDSMRAPQGLKVWSIGFTVNRFEMRNGEEAALEATWKLTAPSAKGSVQLCRAMATQPVTENGVAPLVEAQKTLLQRFSRAIAANIHGASVPQESGLQNLRCSTTSASR